MCLTFFGRIWIGRWFGINLGREWVSLGQDAPVQCHVYALIMLIVSIVVVILLLRVSTLLAILFFIAAIVTIPGLVIHRREAAHAPEIGQEAEGQRHGWMRLLAVIGLDVTGIALGVLLLIMIVLLIGLISGHHPGRALLP